MRRARLIVSVNLIFVLVLSAFPSFSQEKVKFPIGASSKTLGYGPLWVAWKREFFDQQGFDAQVVLLRGTPPTVAVSEPRLAEDPTKSNRRCS